MATEIFDYVREVNQLSEELLRSHADLLERKNIRRKSELIRVIKLDLDKLTHALLEVRENRASSVLRTFFRGSVIESRICGRLAHDRIFHVGFEIHEPLDLVLQGIHHWIEHSKRSLGVNMHVKEFLRFPASEAFQVRVGAYAEIMRIWIQVGERVLMLELFDIHRPSDSVLATAPKPTHRNFHGLFDGKETAHGHPRRLSLLFANDEIWHYALYVKSAAEVIELHEECRSLSRLDSGYSLPYAAPVHNQNDDSFHTKIVRRHPGFRRLELEFVTQYGTARTLSAAE